MDRRHFVTTLMSLPLIAAIVEGCRSEAADAPRHRTPSIADALLAASAANAFGMSLYRQVARALPGVNVVVSPTSVAVGLAMVSAGARNTTLEELIDTLDIGEPDDLHRAMNALLTELDARGHGQVTLSLFNSLWPQAGVHIEERFRQVLESEYAASPMPVDFRGDAEAARRTIDAWIADETGGRMPQPLEAGAVDATTSLVVVNAAHLETAWAIPFDVADTVPALFTLLDGSEVEVPSMSTTGLMRYATGDGWRAVEIDFAGGELSMLVFALEAGFIDLFEEIFLVTDATPYLQEQPIALRLPRFDLHTNLDLTDSLVAMGLESPFGDRADFSGITGDEALRVAVITHQANVTVDEAAAADAIEDDQGGSSDDVRQPVTFHVDHPFVFVVRDRVTEANIFIGRVADPRG